MSNSVLSVAETLAAVDGTPESHRRAGELIAYSRVLDLIDSMTGTDGDAVRAVLAHRVAQLAAGA